MENLFSIRLCCFLAACIFMLTSACSKGSDSETARKAVYVKPYIDYKGKYHKGHLRMPVSTKKNAIKNQNRSKYYYKTKGKYRRKK